MCGGAQRQFRVSLTFGAAVERTKETPMAPRLTPIERCVDVAGLAPHEIVLGVSPGKKHERMLANYRRSRRSSAVARVKIVADLRAAVRRGAAAEAADLLLVLRRLLALEPARRDVRRPAPAARRRCNPPRNRASWAAPSASRGGGASEVVALPVSMRAVLHLQHCQTVSLLPTEKTRGESSRSS